MMAIRINHSNASLYDTDRRMKEWGKWNRQYKGMGYGSGQKSDDDDIRDISDDEGMEVDQAMCALWKAEDMKGLECVNVLKHHYIRRRYDCEIAKSLRISKNRVPVIIDNALEWLDEYFSEKYLQG